MGFIALCLAIAISIEIYSSNKKYRKKAEEEKKTFESLNNTQTKMNIKESADIKYVEEDTELEKTKAKLELASLRERLKKEEEEKQRLLEINLALAKKNVENEEKVQEVVNVENNIETHDETHSIEKKEALVKEINEVVLNDIKNNENIVNDKIDEKNDTSKIEVLEDEDYLDDSVTFDDYNDDEESAIISYEELKNAKSFGYTDDEMEKYLDEKDAIISIQELEKLYLESQNINVSNTEETKIDFEMKRVEDLPEIADKNNFQNSPFISPVYGMAKTEQEIVLEQTANLEKLNEEIKKTNEFLKTLKDLKKNLQ